MSGDEVTARSPSCPKCGLHPWSLAHREHAAPAPAPGSDGLRGWPDTVSDALRELADWLDENDRLIDKLAAARGIERHNSGDDMQRAMRHLADWFAGRPDLAAQAWGHVLGRVT